MPKNPSADEWKRLTPLIDAVLDAPGADRASVIAEATSGDADLQAAVSAFLLDCDREAQLLERPAIERFAALFTDEEARPPRLPADRYRVEREIGRGGMAVVFLARDLRHERDVAVKVVHHHVTAGVGTERFLAEIRVVARLSHPHIIPLLDSGEEEAVDNEPRRLWYSMPVVAGETLRNRLAREGPMALRDVVSVVGGIASALDYAHRQGFIHRDVKPANILLQESDARLADFGVALPVERSASGERTGHQALVGTPAYMSPEQVRSGQPLDARTDVYALGCVIYEMVTGRAPYTGATPVETLAQVLRDTPVPVRTLRPEAADLDPVITRAMARDPADRYATTRELAEAVSEAVVGRHGRGSAVAAAPDSARHGRLRSWGRVAAAAGLVLAVIAAVIWGNRTPPASRVASIAALPLVNLGPDPRDSTLADALTEELISMLGHEPDKLHAISSTSSFYFRNRPADVRAIADSLGADWILEGSVRRVDPNVRVQVRLVRGEDGSVRWQRTYERPVRAMLIDEAGRSTVQEDVTRAVAGVLGVRLGAIVGTGEFASRSVPASGADQRFEAQRLYWAGSDMRLLRSVEGARRAMEYFRQAIAADSTFAPAHAALARHYATAWPPMDLPWSERLAQANRHVGHALALDSRLSEAHQARGAIYRNDLRLTEAEASFRRALAMDPMNVFAREVLVRVYVMMGRPDDALREALLAVQQDPRRPSAHAELGHALVANGRCDDAHAALRRTNALSGDPPLLRVDVYEAECLAMTGRWNDAIRILRPRAAPGDRGALSLLGYVLAGADSTAEAEKILDLLRAQAREHEGWSFSVAEVFAGLSRFDSAFTWLHRAIDERSIVPRVMHPMHRALRADPRFAEIQAKLLRQNR